MTGAILLLSLIAIAILVYGWTLLPSSRSTQRLETDISRPMRFTQGGWR